jgi:hypothetical protein
MEEAASVISLLVNLSLTFVGIVMANYACSKRRNIEELGEGVCNSIESACHPHALASAVLSLRIMNQA